MKKLYISLILLAASINANQIKSGEKLYTTANCQKCHLQGEKFDPNSINKEGMLSQVKDKKGIHKWVESCDNFFNVGWFPEEVDKVAEYLNKSYYKFKK